MKNLKKLISVVLCVAMVASFLVVGTSASSYPDVEDTASYSAAVELLSALEILKGDENGNFNPDAEIKRSEFAAVVCRALGQENAATSSVSKFDDVAADHWAVGYIGWAAGKGIVNGYGDGTFGPDKAVSYQEAVKMIMAALGYGKLAENKGGYPYGYLSLAGTYGVTAGLSANPTEAAPRSLVAQLIYNALEAPLMDTSYYSTTEERYVVYDGSKAADYEERTILSQYLDIIKVKGEVVANYKTVPTLLKKDGRSQVRLALSKVYNVSDRDDYQEDLYVYETRNTVLGWYLKTALPVYEGATGAADYLAATVDAYLFFNEDEELELKAIIGDGKSMETLVVTKDIVTADAPAATASPVVFEYWEDIEADSQTTELDVATNAVVYLNGVELGDIRTAGKAEFDALDAATFNGTVTFVGPKGEAFSKVFIEDYIYGQVEKIDLEDEYIVTDAFSIELSEDEKGDKFVYTIYKDGEEIALEDVKEGDVLSVLAPNRDVDNRNFVDIYVSSETITGQVTGADSTNNKKYEIDDVEYLTESANLLSVGETGTFYLTADGKIYSVEITSTVSDNYGFILKVGSTSSFGENTYQIRLFTKEGTTATYTVAPTLKVSTWNASTHKYVETPYKRANNGQDTFMATLSSWTAPNTSQSTVYTNAEQRLITYTLDGDMITKMTLASNAVANADLKKAYDVDGFTTGTYKPATEKFAGYVYTDATKLFYAPIEATTFDADGNPATLADNATAGYAIDEDKVALLNIGSLDEEKTDYAGYTYATNADKEFGAAVITSDLGFAGKASALAVVIGKAEGLDANGEKADTLTVLRGGDVATYVVNDDADFTSFASLASGDIIQFVLNGVDEITAAELVYARGTNGLGTLNTAYTTASAGAEIQFVYGIVSDVASKFITLSDNHTSGTRVDYAVNYEEGSTLAKVDMAKIAYPNTAIAKASSASSFRATKDTYTDQYVMVARVVDEEIVDAVAYALDVNTLDANKDGAEINAETYSITLA